MKKKTNKKINDKSHLKNHLAVDEQGEWKTLTALVKKMKKENKKNHLRELLRDKNRAKDFSLKNEYLYFDYSKNWITQEALKNIFSLLEKVELKARIVSMLKGEPINFTEKRRVLHTAVRTLDNFGYLDDDLKSIPEAIKEQRKKIKALADKVQQKKYLGFTGKPITDVVNLGIGGSHLGVKFLTEALVDFKVNDLDLHFISNVDGLEAQACLKKVDLETTLFIIVSKSFTTKETLLNGQLIKKIYKNKYAQNKKYSLKEIYAQHIIAVSANAEKAEQFGVGEANIFTFADFIGGRYSLFSSVGLALVLKIGYKNYQKILEGAKAMDEHFLNQGLSENLPVILAALSIWQINFCNNPHQLIIPYSFHLRSLPDYLQQLDMESNGKSMNEKSQEVNFLTGPDIWGGVGTNSQHSFFQSLHQGTVEHAIDFIGVKKVRNTIANHQTVLMANMLAQGEALAVGKTKSDWLKESPGMDMSLLTHRLFPGNRSSNTIILSEISPQTMGYLVALYEHKVFVQGVFWGINSFDQWGVELGKSLAEDLEVLLKQKIRQKKDNIKKPVADKVADKFLSSSTRSLVNYLKS